MNGDDELPLGRGYGATLSTPTPQDIEQARITDFARWLGRGVGTDGSYRDLWQWSVTHPGEF